MNAFTPEGVAGAVCYWKLREWRDPRHKAARTAFTAWAVAEFDPRLVSEAQLAQLYLAYLAGWSDGRRAKDVT